MELPRKALPEVAGFQALRRGRIRGFANIFVTMIYFGMLRRVPEQAGFDYWVAQLGSGASALDLVNGFLGAEYRARFLP